MFMLSIKTNEAKCLKASIKDEAWCWHMRFGHLNFGELKVLGDKKMVKGMPHINHPNQLCEACKKKAFGSIAYSYVPNQGRSKLDDRSVKHVFIGYDANSKGYKLYNRNNGKMINLMKKRHGIRRKEDTYDFLPYFEEGHQEVIVPNEFSTPPPSQTPSIHEALSSKGSSSERA
ncbi:hypothetical protein CR513_17617, partial [Mucuna pruriens]